MAFIYKITNDINNKVYIGKTEKTVEQRFKQHCRESHFSRANRRPLYAAMNKYGIEHFKVETIEETNSPEEREQFWIKEYNSYGSTGYNATKGGDGSKRADYDLICSLWKQGLSCRDISQKLGYDGATIRAALQDNGISAEERHKRGALKISKQVSMLDLKTNKVLKTFPSITDSLTYLNKSADGASHISQVCRGKRKSAYGYKWKYEP